MKKNYIAPLMEAIEIEELCDQTMLTFSKKENITTPGNDTQIPGDGTKPGLGGDEGESTDPAAKGNTHFFGIEW